MTAGVEKALDTGIKLVRHAAVVVVLLPIRVYQLAISPYMPMNCRYWPSCSAYAVEAVRRHGPLGGTWLALQRVLRCHPWGGWGYDPVPHPYDEAADACSHGKDRADARSASPNLPMPRPAGLNER